MSDSDEEDEESGEESDRSNLTKGDGSAFKFKSVPETKQSKENTQNAAQTKTITKPEKSSLSVTKVNSQV